MSRLFDFAVPRLPEFPRGIFPRVLRVDLVAAKPWFVHVSYSEEIVNIFRIDNTVQSPLTVGGFLFDSIQEVNGNAKQLHFRFINVAGTFVSLAGQPWSYADFSSQVVTRRTRYPIKGLSGVFPPSSHFPPTLT